MEKEGTNKPEGALKGLLKIIVIALAVYGAMSLFGVGSSRQGNLGQRPPQGQYDPAEGWGPDDTVPRDGTEKAGDRRPTRNRQVLKMGCWRAMKNRRVAFERQPPNII